MEIHPKSEEVDDKLSPNWLELPQEVTVTILQKVGAVDILENVQRVCTQWESLCKEPSFWRTIIYINVDTSLFDLNLDSLFKEAVDRSCGGLIDLQFIRCHKIKLLKYATQRCTKIRRLRLVSSFLADDGLCEAAKMLPLLEDLEISSCFMVTSKSLDTFGECCPLLRSLKMNRFYAWLNPLKLDDDDSEAMSIAENMVHLRHLQLLENELTNKGLKAILDNCIHLESLDLRQCPNLDLEDCSLAKRCMESIRDFRDPSDTFCYFDNDTIIYDNDEAALYGSYYSYDSDVLRNMFTKIL